MLLVEALAVKLGCQIDRVAFLRGARAIDRLVNSANRFSASVQKTGAFTSSLLGAAVKGIGVYTAAMTGFVAATVKESQAAKSAALATGLTTQAIQELHYVARRAGVETSTLDTALANLAKKAYLASRAEPSAAKLFYMLGTNIRGANGQLKTTDTLLEDMAERFESFNKTQQLALAQVLAGSLGSSRESLMLILARGKQGIRDLRQEAIRSGTIISPEIQQKADETREAFVQLSMVLRGLSYSIGSQFFEDFTRGLKHLSDWLKKNRQLVLTTIVTPMKMLVKVVKFLAKNFEDLKAAIGSLLIYKAFLLLLPTAFGQAMLGAVGLGGAAKAAFIAMGAALRGFLLKMGPLLVMSFLLYAIFDEIITMFRGGKTVIGDFVEQLNRIIDTDWGKLDKLGKVLKVLAHLTPYASAKSGLEGLQAFQEWRGGAKEVERTKRLLQEQGKWDYRQDFPKTQKEMPTMHVPMQPSFLQRPRESVSGDIKANNTVNATFNIETSQPSEVSTQVRTNLERMLEDMSTSGGGLYPSYVEDNS